MSSAGFDPSNSSHLAAVVERTHNRHWQSANGANGNGNAMGGGVLMAAGAVGRTSAPSLAQRTG